MWLLYAVGSALFAGLTSILAKCGIRKTDSTVATAIRTIIVLIFAWVMVFVVGSQGTIASIPARSLVFLGLSGLATGASWLCYFYALQRGPIDKVVPIDKSSTVMTILLAALLLGESVTLTRGIGVVLIAAGTFLMIEKKGGVQKEENGWMLAAFGSAIFAALTSILGKVGITGVESNLGTALRTGVVHGVCAGQAGPGEGGAQKRAWLHLSVGPGDGCQLAVLLQSAAARPGQPRRAHR